MSKYRVTRRRREVAAPSPSNIPVLVGELEALQILGGSFKPISRHTLYRGIRAGRFPRGVRLGPNMVRYVLTELEAVVKDAIAARVEQ